MERLQDFSISELDIPDEIKQQVNLVLAKLREAIGRIGATFGVVDESTLAEQLHLTEITDLTHESMVLHEMVTASSKDLGKSMEKLSTLLKQIEELVQTAIPYAISALPGPTGQVTPVRTPESDSMSAHLHSLMTDWSKTRSASACTSEERSMIESHLSKLVSGPDDQRTDDQRAAALAIRLLAKRNYDYRVAIAEAGGIPILEHLLTALDSGTQVNAVTGLLNLSFCEDNKRRIVQGSAVLRIVQVLLRSSIEEARANAAAILFSLSIVLEYKERIGFVGAIPPLVKLLSDGSHREKKDAAIALHSLCVCHGNKVHGNKVRAVRSDIIPTLMKLLRKSESDMKDKALQILDVLLSNSEAIVAIGEVNDVALILVELIRNGSPTNKENAIGVLDLVCSGDQKYLGEAHQLGVKDLLMDLIGQGTTRVERLAKQLLDRLFDSMVFVARN